MSGSRIHRKSHLSPEVRRRSLKAINDMRHGVSLSGAARENRVSPRTIRKHFGNLLIQDRAGARIRATKSDRLVRYLQIPGPNGPVEIKVRGSEEARKAARFSAAVGRALAGDIKALKPWEGQKIGGVKLITAIPEIKALAQNELLPQSLYRSLSGGAA